MSEQLSFADLIARVRGGDGRAEFELVERYEPTVQMVVRRRLADSPLRRLMDSLDICQSVFANFFARAALGQYELETEEQLLKLLVTMALNRLRNYYHKYSSQAHVSSPDQELVDPASGPSTDVAVAELEREFRTRLSEDERQLVDRRALSRSWADIAAELGGNPDALRMRYSRAIVRVLRELGLDFEPA